MAFLISPNKRRIIGTGLGGAAPSLLLARQQTLEQAPRCDPLLP